MPFLALVLAVVPTASAQDASAAKDPRNFTWVEQGVLAIGGGGLTEADVEWLAANGFAAIADFRQEHEDPRALIEAKGMAFLDMPIDSASNINATQLASFVAWAKEQKAAGRPIYIHCTNGWHRAAAFAVAWDLATEREPYDEAAREAAQRRPGTVMRAVSALLDYEAELAGTPQLAVTLVSARSRPEPGVAMDVVVEVHANGAPASNAIVKVWSEESRIRLEGATDANGRFAFPYVAPSPAPFMDHLYARASLPGFADGADNVEFLFGQPARSRGPLEVDAERTGEGVDVRATSGGRAIPVRVVATAPGWTAFESSDRGVVTFPDPPSTAIDIRVVSWGSEGGRARIDPAAPAAPPPPPPPAELAPPPSRQEMAAERASATGFGAPPLAALPTQPTPAPGAAEESPYRLSLRYAAAGIAGALCLALYVALSRRRAGIGNR